MRLDDYNVMRELKKYLIYTQLLQPYSVIKEVYVKSVCIFYCRIYKLYYYIFLGAFI